MTGRVEFIDGFAETLRKRGFATEGARPLVRFALELAAITEVCADSVTFNVASHRILQKAGYVRTGQCDTKECGQVDWWVLRNQHA